MNHSLDLSLQLAADRRIHLSDRHPKAARNRRERRIFRRASRHAPDVVPNRGR